MESWEQLLDDLRSEFLLREGELRLLHEVDLRILKEGEELASTIAFVAEETQDLLRADHVEIFIRRGRSLVTAQASPVIDPDEFAYVNSALEPCIAHGQAVIFRDLRTEPFGGHVPRNSAPGTPF